MKYDDASWHCEGNYPAGLPDENAATHIGMFLKWCICQDLYSEFLLEESGEEIGKVKADDMTGAQFLMYWDGKFLDDMLSETGNLFAKDYYGTGTKKSKFAKKFSDYDSDYHSIFNDKEKRTGIKYESIYHIEDTKENYDLVAKKIDERFAQWQKGSKKTLGDLFR